MYTTFMCLNMLYTDLHTCIIYRLEYSSLVTPRQTLLYDMNTYKYTIIHQKEVPNYSISHYTTARIYAPSRDGRTIIPITLVYSNRMHPGLSIDSTGTVNNSSPVPSALILEGYGSYGCASDPYFDFKRICCLDLGIIYAVPHIRGGNELGRYWYEVEGKYTQKKNTFYDFIDATNYLVSQGYTTKELLGVYLLLL